MNTFTTRTDAIDHIVTAIEATGEVADAHAEFDIDAIADRVIGAYPGYTIADADFWAAVQDNAK